MTQICAIKSKPSRVLTLRPPMGWNSYDCYGLTVTESEVLDAAEAMSRQLLSFGWDHVVVDAGWYLREVDYDRLEQDPSVWVIDGHGRCWPAPERFPCAAKGDGLRPMVDRIHAMGMKFGLHFMRGIPRIAVERNLPVLGTTYHARDVADTKSVCEWSNDMYGLNMDHPGANAYYRSVINLFADWGVDYLKMDDVGGPIYHAQEIEAVHRAVKATGRPMVLSLSPGDQAELSTLEHRRHHAQLWRISPDVWDKWEHIKAVASCCRRWASISCPDSWPDADMLPLGRLGIRQHPLNGPTRQTRLSRDEQVTMLAQWCIVRSPLFFGGDPTCLDPYTLSLLTHTDLLSINQHSQNNRVLFVDEPVCVWTADIPESNEAYLAVFNTGDEHAHTHVDLAAHRLPARCIAQDLLRCRDTVIDNSLLEIKVRPHSARVYRLIPARGPR